MPRHNTFQPLSFTVVRTYRRLTAQFSLSIYVFSAFLKSADRLRGCYSSMYWVDIFDFMLRTFSRPTSLPGLDLLNQRCQHRQGVKRGREVRRLCA